MNKSTGKICYFYLFDSICVSFDFFQKKTTNRNNEISNGKSFGALTRAPISEELALKVISLYS